VISLVETSMRDALAEALLDLGAELPNLVVIGADTSGSLKTAVFATKFPNRFFNVGIAEQNMIGIAAGFALAGKKVVCGSYAVFVPGRAVDQIRNTIAYCNLDVKIIGSHGGISVGPDGGSHQAIEDIAIMRSIPNMKVIVPADAVSARSLIKQATRMNGPFYIRLVRPNSPIIYTKEEQLKFGQGNILKDGSDVSIIASGLMVDKALKAAIELEHLNIKAEVIDMHTIKPLDRDLIERSAKRTGTLVTVEDHNIIGGLGSAVAECVTECYPVKVYKIGITDVFGESGEPAELFEKYGLTEKSIINICLKAVTSR
jgi:transketolase